ncbi:RdgB/HAM1 family non-canonical purine NTP pyrophosphatase [Alicyclobacillus tolerans]|uniref:RdgB/HAM1 family non-canonical purine NTP pyrophosphatase n=1 Tax=Alicyclobacillus tolerans TaxID=90970 RepID=UPI001F00C9C4|nr:RdgB/HAM1 family non-canonical purine NTP pyrophosphatase [Alicyclobacillus tolerans]MCF8563517.1 RdgB/HAM1 family non-canonical purine NTP pyrophosphatase [Alicyclobacillus tolerans]
MSTLFIASKNRHKVDEFRDMLAELDLAVLPLPDDCPESPETGATFAENAVQKARFYSAFVDGFVLADDSGLCVDYLGGAPGVFSARYAGDHGNDSANNAKLLRELEGVPDAKRTAQFVCALAVHHPQWNADLVVEGSVPGLILTHLRGDQGFGYDPLFYLPELGKSVAELEPSEKNRVSHRALAVRHLLQRWRGEVDAPVHRQ